MEKSLILVSSLSLIWKTRPRDESGLIPGIMLYQCHVPIAIQSIALLVLKLPPTMIVAPVAVLL